MASPSGQNFSNHARFFPAYHFFAAPLGIVYLVWSIRRLIAFPGADALYMVIGALAIFGALVCVRVSPLTAQNRIIRLEEQLRFARILPADLQSRVDDLTLGQLIALRFASDAEAPELLRKVLANPEMRPKEIKAAIKNWKGDYLRV